MSVALHRDFGAFCVGINALNPEVVTTTGDASERNGNTVDRRASTDVNDLYLSGKVVIPASYSLAAAKTVTIKSNLQHSSSSTAWADLVDKDGSTAYTVTYGSTGSTAAQTGHAEAAYDIDLSSAKRYIRIQVTPTLSATATDTVDIAGVLILGPGDMVPAD